MKFTNHNRHIPILSKIYADTECFLKCVNSYEGEHDNSYNNSRICSICKQELNINKVRDHGHVTGKFRGAAHNKCSINLRLPSKLPIIFHNLQGYDGHIIF